MRDGNVLGEYLRSRREQVSPVDAGFEALGRRRVEGLRREEVATLAGISADYYLRLEQGRDRNPSAQVVAALARVLRLDDTATAHLLRLASATGAGPGARRAATVPGTIGALLRALELPAFVEDTHFDVLGSNTAARHLSPSIAAGRNRVLSTFLDPDARSLFLDWDVVSAELVAGFRASVAGSATDSRTSELVAELSAQSGRFRDLWARHDVEALVGRPPVRMRHPEVGDLTLMRDNVLVEGTNGLRLVIYHAEPGSEASAKLRSLALPGPGSDPLVAGRELRALPSERGQVRLEYPQE